MGPIGLDAHALRELIDKRSSSNEEIRTVELGTPTVVRACLALYAASLLAMALGELLPAVVRVPLVVLPLTFVPGALFVLLWDEAPVVDATRLLYAYGTSLIVLMFVGAVTNIVLPLAGVATPLSKAPLAAAITAVVVGLGLAVRRRRPEGRVELNVPALFAPTPLGFVALPLVTILGVMVLNASGFNVPVLGALLVIAGVPLLAIRRVRPEWLAFGIWSTSLAILYHKSLWKYAGFGGRPHGIQAWKARRWSPGVVELSPYSSELLPTGLLFPMYARLSDVFILTQYEVVNPLFVSFIPVAVFVATRRFVDADRAFLAAATFAFAHPFYLQYPTAGRAASPVIFLALFGVVLVDDDHGPLVSSVFGILFLFGIVVSHYGTAYYMIFALFIAVGALFGLRSIDRNRMALRNLVPDGGTSFSEPTTGDPGGRPTLLSPSLVLYYATATLAWFLYMRAGWKFQLLIKHIVDNFQQMTQGAVGSGRTAARLQKSYGTSSIRVAKYVYITIAILMAVGFTVVLYRRLLDRDRTVPDQYFVVASSVFFIFGMTLMFRNWGGGRPMMITFAFSTVFAVVGITWLFAGAADFVGRSRFADRDLVPSVDWIRNQGGKEAFAVLLATWFVLNSGVAAATVLPGFAPSNVPVQEQLADSDDPNSQLTVHRQVDIATHTWTVRHRGEYQVYGDTYGARQYDWYRPSVTATLPGVDAGYDREAKPKVFDPRQGSLDSGYHLMMGHNEQLGKVWIARFGTGIPLEALRLSERNRVYTNGESSVYFAASPTNTTNSSAR